jgi:hypothetical protein
MIHALVDPAIREKDHAPSGMPRWFMKEQEEENAGYSEKLPIIFKCPCTPGLLLWILSAPLS